MESKPLKKMNIAFSGPPPAHGPPAAPAAAGEGVPAAPFSPSGRRLRRRPACFALTPVRSVVSCAFVRTA